MLRFPCFQHVSLMYFWSLMVTSAEEYFAKWSKETAFWSSINDTSAQLKCGKNDKRL